MDLKSKNTFTTMQLAFKKAKFRVKRTTSRWPRRKGPRGIRLDCSSGFAVDFVK